jgi:hypothetical protein
MPKAIHPRANLFEQKTFVEQFLSSGLPQKEFCQLHNLNKSTFKNWVFRYKSNVKSPQPIFVPISLDADISENANDDDVGNQDVRPAAYAKPSAIAQPNLLVSTNVSAAPAKIPLNHNCDDRLTIICNQLTVQIPVGFDTSYLRTILKIVADL